MRFLNGFKTALGTVALAIVGLSDANVIVLIPEKARPYITGAAAMLTVLGLVHKVEKADERKKDEEVFQAAISRLRDEAKKDGEA